jgi:hypothetical protein
LRFQINKRGGRSPQVQPEFTQFGDKIIGSTIWRDDDGADVERYQVLTIRDGKISDLQGCRTRTEAERFAKRRSDISAS